MIIDAHLHVFPRLGTGPDAAVNMRPLQCHFRDCDTFWRVKAGGRVDRALLELPSEDIGQMPDVYFRVGAYGQVEFTLGGVDYYAQGWPPHLQTMSAPPSR